MLTNLQIFYYKKLERSFSEENEKSNNCETISLQYHKPQKLSKTVLILCSVKDLKLVYCTVGKSMCLSFTSTDKGSEGSF